MKKSILLFFFSLCLFFGVYLLYGQAHDFLSNREIESSSTEVMDKTLEKLDVKSIADSEAQNKKTGEKFVASLRKKFNNNAVVGRVQVKALGIDQPIVKSNDDKYWLHHNIYRKFSDYGTVFLDMYNKPDFSDDINTIFGHKMLNSAMFSNLVNLLDQSYVNKIDQTITLTTNQGVERYRVFSVMNFDTLNRDFYRTDYDINYIEHCLRESAVDFKYDRGQLNNSKRFLCLSTCRNSYSDGRVIVFAYKI